MSKLVEHKHLIARVEVESFFGPNADNIIRAWMVRLIADQDMNIMVGPFAAYCDRPGLRGWTIATIIETSHCAVHVWDEVSPILIQFDLYTCGKLDVAKIKQAFEAFGLVSWETKTFDREYNLTEIT